MEVSFKEGCIASQYGKDKIRWNVFHIESFQTFHEEPFFVRCIYISIRVIIKEIEKIGRRRMVTFHEKS
ncbi:hypothetical protein [Heyndrickxia sporothermodurans]|uniref:Uncharacterized protein n=1 Tax=Heyndrickxia sporothermodurans TaxID=46224 RepID=A0A150L0X8_9BACI|nr:hypothetical protein B4102_3103 [Heyndrickxia sporothermodurans]